MLSPQTERKALSLGSLYSKSRFSLEECQDEFPFLSQETIPEGLYMEANLLSLNFRTAGIPSILGCLILKTRVC